MGEGGRDEGKMKQVKGEDKSYPSRLAEAKVRVSLSMWRKRISVTGPSK